MLNKLQIIGRVGRDAESRFTNSSQRVTNFSVAVSEKYTKQSGELVENTIWLRVETWGKLAEVCGQYVKKGMLVYVEGKIKGDESGNPRIYQKQDGSSASNFEVTAQVVRFLSKVEHPQTVEEDNPF